MPTNCLQWRQIYSTIIPATEKWEIHSLFLTTNVVWDCNTSFRVYVDGVLQSFAGEDNTVQTISYGGDYRCWSSLNKFSTPPLIVNEGQLIVVEAYERGYEHWEQCTGTSGKIGIFYHKKTL